jgi:hypothetical protein
MLGTLKKLLGQKEPSDPQRGQGPRWEKKDGERVKWVRKPAAAPLITAPEELECPTCGEPMLREWGTNCPRCKPRLAMSRTVAHTGAIPIVDTGLTLGWLVVLQSPDRERCGGLIELEEPLTILSRSACSATPGVRCHVFEDEFMSSRHATVRRPSASSSRDAAFVLEERREPATPNGVYVNSQRIPTTGPYELSDGDIVRLGGTELQFKSLWLPPGVGGRG